MRPNKLLLLWSSLATLALLVWAAYRENYAQDWRLIADGVPAPAARRMTRPVSPCSSARSSCRVCAPPTAA